MDENANRKGILTARAPWWRNAIGHERGRIADKNCGQQKTRLAAGFCFVWQPRMDSNHRMPESESGALPLGDGDMGQIVTQRLALGELRSAASLVQTDLLTLDFTRVA